jgi:hypothetical protein
MATPTTPQKRLLAAGARKASEWGSALALGAGYGILITGDGGLARKQAYGPAKEADTPFVLEGDLGPIDAIDFSPEFDLRYAPGKLGMLMALLFGTAGVPADQGSGGWKHTIQFADSIVSLFATYAVERPGKIWEVASAKPFGLDLSVAGNFVKGKISLRGNTLIDDSAVNTATQLDALTYDDRENRVKFTQCSVKMNAQSGGDVTSETALQINNMTLGISRPLDTYHAAGDVSIIEPQENDHPSVSLSLNFPRMNAVNAAYFATFIAETEQKLLLQFTGPLIGGAIYYSWKFFFPRMRIVEIDFPFDEVVPGSIKFEAEEAAANPTGMSYKRPYIELINKQNTDYLA